MLIKIVVILILLMIFISLGSGFFFLLRDRGRSHRAVKSLTWRIGLSLTLFIMLMIAYGTGLITPHGVYPAP